MIISDLLQQQGARMRVFDMGRRIQVMDLDLFRAVENMQSPWPSPYLKHAWLGMMSWHPDKPGQHGIWFIKLPLDERNLLQAAARDAFVAFCLKQAHNNPEARGEAPYSYKPDASRMAYFHAMALQELGAGNSRYYATTRAYLGGDIGWDSWQQLGLQGLAEVVAAVDRDHNETLLVNAIPHLPTVPLHALLGFMENIQPTQALTSALNDRLATLIGEGATSADLAAFARAISQSRNITQRRQLLQAMLAHPASRTVELLAAMASRCWLDLDGDVLVAYLEALARNDQGEQAFNALVADLMTLPAMRERMLAAFTRQDLSPLLRQAFDGLLVLVRGGMK
ncbi:DUF3549 family protein [Parathalassolituus penaei]|uniref:DUF3549 family protein n=1 Tax=Parathalassolituus penaei TaxID=2997323 RepID=A0A9X3IRW3_9GAMM|nr:DUF3549 family protein [Parathalassolituus penaei]MCY0964254.1 DUF3549 family protein [Parathalassolituus penaei]